MIYTASKNMVIIILLVQYFLIGIYINGLGIPKKPSGEFQSELIKDRFLKKAKNTLGESKI